MTDPRILRLRIELFAAAQMLTGQDAADFWTLLGEMSIAFEDEFKAGAQQARRNNGLEAQP